MKLTLIGHDDRYAVEQLQMALFGTTTEGEARCTLYRGKVWLTAVTQITLAGKTTRASRRMKASEETVRLRRRCLQQSYYTAALPHLSKIPPWGALSGFIHAQSALRNTDESGEFALGHLFCFSEFGNTLRDNHLLDLFGIVIISQRVIKSNSKYYFLYIFFFVS